MARLTLANMAADSGVLRGIILVRSSFAIGYFAPGVVEPASAHDGRDGLR
jgi:hypothetical protein